MRSHNGPKEVCGMKDENDAVTSDEMLVRLIWEAHYQADLEEPVRKSAFNPKEFETDGISVFRAACLSAPEDALAVIAEEKRERYAVALIPVVELASLGLSVKPAKIQEIPGHAVLPELNIVDFKQDRNRWVEVSKTLAMLANQNIIRRPKA
jgi:hypothetical protein